jgi:glyoxylase-like metal-dependent hydrolase (beta-lactamase superfamily II)
MRQIVPDVYLIEGLRTAHAYLLAQEDGFMLVDAGTPGELAQITAQLAEGGCSLADIKAIVLTHCHSDHTGNLAELARRSGAQVLAHQEEVPYIERTAALPVPSVLQRILFWLMDRVSAAPPCKVDRALQDGDTVEALGGLRVVHAPRHTPGNIALYGPERQILFCGDTIFHGAPLSRKQGIQVPPRIICVDADRAARSAKVLAELPLSVVCFGHGDPLLDRAQERLKEAIN